MNLPAEVFDQLLPGPDAIERATGQRPSYPTYVRWTQRGLEFAKVGGARLTSPRMVRDFVDRQTAMSSSHNQTPKRMSRRTESAHERAERELAAAGI